MKFSTDYHVNLEVRKGQQGSKKFIIGKVRKEAKRVYFKANKVSLLQNIKIYNKRVYFKANKVSLLQNIKIYNLKFTISQIYVATWIGKRS
jgi:hypothetical protein